MKSILLSTLAAAVTLTAAADVTHVRTSRTVPERITETANASSFAQKYRLNEIAGSQMSITGKDLKTLHAPENTTGEGLVTDPQGSKERYAMSVDIFLSNLGATHVGGFGANAIVSEDGSKFYSRAFTLNFFQQGYTEGAISGDDITITSGQYVYDTKEGEKAYMYAAFLSEGEDWPEIVDSFVLSKDEKGRYVSQSGYYLIVMTEEEAEAGIDDSTDIISFGTNYVFTPLPADVAESKIPEDAEIFETQLVANSLLNYGESTTFDVIVGVSGDKIYINGLSEYLPESCLTGTKTAENTYTFYTDQYVGYFDEGEYPYIYEYAMVNPIYFDGESLYHKAVESVNMTFSEDKTMLTLENEAGIFICAYGDMSTWNDVLWNMMIGDLDRPLTPEKPAGLECYGSYGAPYVIFNWSNMSVEGIPMNTDNLWCEIIVNGEPYVFKPEYHEGLAEATDKIYYNTSGVDGIYPGSFSTIYLKEFEGRFDKVKSVGVQTAYQCGDEVKYSELVYASGFKPFEDKAFVPSAPSNVVYYKDYYSEIRFKFDGKDTEGNVIPERLLAIEILLDGKPLVFKDSEYFFNGGEGADVTMIGLAEHAINYSSSLVSLINGVYSLSLWGHGALPEFKTLAIRPVCTGADTFTYGESCEIVLERPATPANPWDVTFHDDTRELIFGALPIDNTGEGLAPWNYGYEVYVNGKLYEFKSDLYELEQNITLIPYEIDNYNFFLTSQRIYDETDWSVIDEQVLMSVKMDKEDLTIDKIGVRAVYTDGEGKTTYSEIINSDGTIGSTSGVDSIGNEDEPVKWYNLQGIEVSDPEPGYIYLRKQGSTATKVLVK